MWRSDDNLRSHVEGARYWTQHTNLGSRWLCPLHWFWVQVTVRQDHGRESPLFAITGYGYHQNQMHYGKIHMQYEKQIMTWSKRRSQSLPSLLTGPFFRSYKERPQSCSLVPLRTFIHVACCPSWQSVLLESVLLLFSKLPCYVCKSVWARLSNPLTPRPRTWKPVPRSWAPVTERQPLSLGKHPSSSSLCSPTCCF